MLARATLSGVMSIASFARFKVSMVIFKTSQHPTVRNHGVAASELWNPGSSDGSNLTCTMCYQQCVLDF